MNSQERTKELLLKIDKARKIINLNSEFIEILLTDIFENKISEIEKKDYKQTVLALNEEIEDLKRTVKNLNLNLINLIEE